MSDTIEIRVPNIGDFRDLPIIAVLVKEGDTVSLESPLVEIESEKATMEVPSPAAGVVRSIVVHVGDTVSEGTPILTLAAAPATAAAAPPPAPAAPAAAAAPAPAAAPTAGPPPATPPADGASSLVELRVPDIGDFADVPVIEVFVAVGDRVEKEAP
jgi:pyruvate dehydrogenase E2 component (dihydrolipoamide acetyltransferase)